MGLLDGWVLTTCPLYSQGAASMAAVLDPSRSRLRLEPTLAAAVLPSLCSLCEILRSAASDAIDKPAIGAHWHARLKAIYEKARDVRATAAEGQILDIQYADLVADPIATVQAIYDHHGYDFTEAFEVAMRQWLDENRQHKHGAHRYTLEEYGVNEDAVREDLNFA